MKERENSAEASIHAVVDSVDTAIDGVKVLPEDFVSNEMLVIHKHIGTKSTDRWTYLMRLFTVPHPLLPWFGFVVRADIVGV